MKAGQIIGYIAENILKYAIFAVMIVAIFRGASEAYQYGYRIFTEPPMTSGEGRIISIEVKSGQDAMEIGKNLEEKGLIDDAKIFWLQELLSEYHDEEQPGIYDLSTSMTAEEMLAVMSEQIEEDEEAQ